MVYGRPEPRNTSGIFVCSFGGFTAGLDKEKPQENVATFWTGAQHTLPKIINIPS